MLCFACPALVMLCLSPGNKLPGYPRRCPAGHCCLSSFHRRLVHTRLPELHLSDVYRIYFFWQKYIRTGFMFLMSICLFPCSLARAMSGRHLFIIAGDIYVSGNGFHHLLPSGRREPGSFASLQTLSYFDSFYPTVWKPPAIILPFGTGLSDLFSRQKFYVLMSS